VTYAHDESGRLFYRAGSLRHLASQVMTGYGMTSSATWRASSSHIARYDVWTLSPPQQAIPWEATVSRQSDREAGPATVTLVVWKSNLVRSSTRQWDS